MCTLIHFIKIFIFANACSDLGSDAITILISVVMALMNAFKIKCKFYILQAHFLEFQLDIFTSEEIKIFPKEVKK